MSNTYATGNHSLGLCQRCGFAYKLNRLREDGETHLLVCDSCFDIEHPAERPFDATDATALRRPSPDIDAATANALDDDRPLGEVVFGTAPYFGTQP